MIQLTQSADVSAKFWLGYLKLSLDQVPTAGLCARSIKRMLFRLCGTEETIMFVNLAGMSRMHGDWQILSYLPRYSAQIFAQSPTKSYVQTSALV